MADTRNVTVQFDDGTTHIYENVPKTVTPDQIESKAKSQFENKKINNISGGAPQAAGQVVKQDQREYVKPSERVGRVGEEMLAGGVFGAIAPELLTAAGGAAAAFPITAPAAPFLFGAGQAARGARLAGAVTGAISGGAGEIAGQAVESKYGPGVKAETARLLGATFGPAPIEYLGTKAGKLITSIAAPFVPGMKTAKTVGELLQDAGVDAASLTAEQKAFIEKKLAEVRGGKPSLDAQKEVYDMLREGAEGIQSQAQKIASALEDQAKTVLEQAQVRAGAVDQQTATRINNLQSQLNSAADKIREEAQRKAQKTLEESKKLADQITKAAENQTAEFKVLQKMEADRIIARGQKEADDLIKQANAQELRLRNYRDKVINITKGYGNAPQQAIGMVGTPDLPTDRGNIIRKGFENVLNGLKENREKIIERFKKPVFDAAEAKEKTGARVEQTPEFQSTINYIDNLINNPQSKLTDIPVTEVRNALLRAKSYLDPRVELEGVVIGKPVSFQGLEITRRYLRDRASGLPAEGYDAISQQQAKDIADRIENIMDQFSPGFKDYLAQYRKASEPINQFTTKLGKAATGKPEGFDIGVYLRDPATLGKEAFSTRGSVEQLISTLGTKQSETLARGYAADSLRNPTSSNIKNFIDANRDWLGAFPALKNDLNKALVAVDKAERMGKKGAKLEQTLGVDIGAIPGRLRTEARRVEEAGGREAEQAIKAGETEAERIERQARATALGEVQAGERLAERTTGEAERDIEKAASKVERRTSELESQAESQKKGILREAEEKAAPLTKEAQAVLDKAQKDADVILAGTTAPARVRDIILSKNAKEWEATSKILLEAPGGKEKFADAVGQVIADRASKSLKGAIEDMKYIGDNLVTYNLMSPEQVSKIQSQLQDIFVTPVSTEQKMTMAQKLVRNALVGYIAVVPPRVAGNIAR